MRHTDQTTGKRNPEKWGDDSGLNVAYKDPYNKRQATEQNA
jgi:hypothetical protein